MALANYSDLQSTLAGYLKRTDLTSQIPDFINLCESRLNTKLRLLQMEQESTTSYTTTTSRFLAFPGNFIELLDLRIKKASEDDTKYREVKPIAPQLIHTRYSSVAQRPEWYTVRDQIELNCSADQSYTLRLHYLKKWDLASDSTNWLMTNHPEAYLYGSLLQAEPYLVNDERVPLWKSLFDEVIQEIDDADQRSRDDEELSTDEIMRMSGSRTRYDIESDTL